MISVGVEDEDRLDQWVEDAESVSRFQFQFQYPPPLPLHVHTCTVHLSRGVSLCPCDLRAHAEGFSEQEARVVARCVFREESRLSGAAGGVAAESRLPLPQGRGVVAHGCKVQVDGCKCVYMYMYMQNVHVYYTQCIYMQ